MSNSLRAGGYLRVRRAQQQRPASCSFPPKRKAGLVGG